MNQVEGWRVINSYTSELTATFIQTFHMTTFARSSKLATYLLLVIVVTILPGIKVKAQSGWEKNSKGREVYQYKPGSSKPKPSTPNPSPSSSSGSGVYTAPSITVPRKEDSYDMVDIYGMRRQRVGNSYTMVDQFSSSGFNVFFDNIHVAPSRLYVAQLYNKWGFVNMKGETVIAFQYDVEPTFDWDIPKASVIKNGVSYFINMKGETLNDKNEVTKIADSINAQNDISLKLAAYSHVGAANVDGSRIVSSTESSARDIYNNSGLINANNDLVIPMKYNFIADLKDGMYAVGKYPAKFGYVNTSGIEVIPPIYDYISDFDAEGYAKASNGKKRYRIDKFGNVEKL